MTEGAEATSDIRTHSHRLRGTVPQHLESLPCCRVSCSASTRNNSTLPNPTQATSLVLSLHCIASRLCHTLQISVVIVICFITHLLLFPVTNDGSHKGIVYRSESSISLANRNAMQTRGKRHLCEKTTTDCRCTAARGAENTPSFFLSSGYSLTSRLLDTGTLHCCILIVYPWSLSNVPLTPCRRTTLFLRRGPPCSLPVQWPTSSLGASARPITNRDPFDGHTNQARECNIAACRCNFMPSPLALLMPDSSQPAGDIGPLAAV